jgi:hypothetical protein
MIRLTALLGALLFGLCALAAPIPRERVPPDASAIKKRFYTSWHEEWLEECAPDGKVEFKIHPYQMAAWQFSEEDTVVWDWSGDLSPCSLHPVKLDTTRTPMRFEIVATNKDGQPTFIVPGIFKFDGPRLILSYPYPAPGWVKWNAKGDYPGRPQDFERRPGVVIAVLERCEYLDQYRSSEQVPK